MSRLQLQLEDREKTASELTSPKQTRGWPQGRRSGKENKIKSKSWLRELVCENLINFRISSAMAMGNCAREKNVLKKIPVFEV
jgi:hypothetical protein